MTNQDVAKWFRFWAGCLNFACPRNSDDFLGEVELWMLGRQSEALTPAQEGTPYPFTFYHHQEPLLVMPIVQHLTEERPLVHRLVPLIPSAWQRGCACWQHHSMCLFGTHSKTKITTKEQQQVRLVSVKAERPNHPSRGGGGSSTTTTMQT